MECKYVRESSCICFQFHPTSTSLFSLVHFKNRLRIIQQNLYTGLIINQLTVPLREQNLEVDNYSLCYNPTLDLILLTLSNHLLIYSLQQKSLLVVAEAQGKNSPYYFSKIATRNNMLYFSSPEQKNIYAVNIQDVIKNAAIQNYVKFKIVANEIEVRDIAVSDRVLVALCSDSVVRIWDRESTNSLKGLQLEVGTPSCLSFSKGMNYLLIATDQGYIQAWDGAGLGVRNTQVMQQKVANIGIKSVSWFHYSGQSQSHRFLVLSEDSSVKIYSLWFERKDEIYLGKSTQLSLLYSTKQAVQENYQIKTHQFANFIFFSPGILLYMVDHYPLIYYPIIVKQPSLNFTELTPNDKKQLIFARDIVFMDGLCVNKITDKIEERLSLQNDLEYKELKILKLDMRPNSKHLPKKTKLMVLYYLNNAIRVLTISGINLNEKSESLGTYKEYSGSWVIFIGPNRYYEPFILIVQEDRQTITVLAEGLPDPDDTSIASEQEKRYMDMGKGEIYTKKINIKIHKIYQTPFRDSYVVLYQSDNLLRFSNNINYDLELINYDVCTTFSLRLDYTDIILDVLWTGHGEMGVVLCLDKVVFINSDLKIMRAVMITGYVVQGQWLGYTLLITTKKDVQYLDILSKPLQAFCLQNLESKYLVLRVMADRIFGIEKINKKVNIRARYFNIMQPLVSGYLNYQKITENPLDQQAIKRIIECFSPYFIVSQEFIQLLNDRNLTNFCKYFIEGNEKMFSRPLRAKVLNTSLKIQRFIPAGVWNRNKKVLLDLFLTYEESKDASDPYEKDKGVRSGEKMRSMIGGLAFDSIKDLSANIESGVSIANNFGEKSLSQIYYDYNKEGEKIRMEIVPFKAENIGEWLGQFQAYMDSHLYFGEEDDGEKIKEVEKMKVDRSSSSQGGDDDDGEFRDLIVYYRCDDGKGTTVEDLSDFHNNGSIEHGDAWISLDGEPMEIEDNWGKKCPPQFSLTIPILFERKINTKKVKDLSLQIWMRPLSHSFSLIQIGDTISLKIAQSKPLISFGNNDQWKTFNQKFGQEEQNTLEHTKRWTHLTIILNQTQKNIQLLLNSRLSFQISDHAFKLSKKPHNLMIGDQAERVEFTEFRMWKKVIEIEEVKENLRSPLGLVFEKRKKLSMKVKEKKKKVATDLAFEKPFSMDL